jgi:hypothetical protein
MNPMDDPGECIAAVPIVAVDAFVQLLSGNDCGSATVL